MKKIGMKKKMTMKVLLELIRPKAHKDFNKKGLDSIRTHILRLTNL